MKAILVDDSAAARQLLKNILVEYCPAIELIGEAEDVPSAVKLIIKNKVELVFLDIDMPGENGFALFNYFDKPTFETIFCTGFTEYALKAFEVSAIDYITKPIGISRVIAAVEKAIKYQGQNQIISRLSALKENISGKKLQKIALPMADGLTFLKVEDILYFEADGSYTTVFTGNQTIVVSKKLKEFDTLLDTDSRFFRIHRSYLVNVLHIKKYNKKESNTLYMVNDAILPLAREKKADFDNMIDEISV
jgi:two-component system, LytTR family, response regulator